MVQEHTVLASRTFDNTIQGFRELVDWLKKHCKDITIPVSVTMEVTGVYHDALAHYLFESGYAVSVVLANRSRNYMRGIGYKSKTDKIDARGLSRMGAEQSLARWQPASKYILELRSLTRHRESLNTALTMARNQMHAHKRMYSPNKEVLASQKALIGSIQQQISLIDKEIRAVVKRDSEFANKVSRIVKSINGVGFLTVLTLVAETNGFELFHNMRQLTSYAGYDVVANESGNRVGKTKISKHGNSHIRRILHMPALNVVRRGTGDYKQTYDRIFHKSFIKMKGYVAIQRKLLCLIYTLWKKDEVFDPNYRHASLSYDLAPESTSIELTIKSF
jgi:transposase